MSASGRLLDFGCFLCLALAPIGRSANLEAGYTYRVARDEVQLAFVATRRDNREITTLSAGDFAIVDNEATVRKFTSFGRSTDASLDVVILVDSSQSVASRLPHESGEILKWIAAMPWAATDSVSVLYFGGPKSGLICARNCRGSQTASRLPGLDANGLTPLFDAVADGAGILSQHRGAGLRPVLIVFSDGEDNISRNSAEDAIEAAQRADAQIYAVDLGKPKARGAGSLTLQMMANSTGGLSFSRRRGAAESLARVLDDLRNTYVVSYTPPSRTAGPHAVRIFPTADSSLHFRSRQAYYYDLTKDSSGPR